MQLCTLDGLAAYLNPTPKQFSSESREKYLQIFSESIATADFLPEDYQYGKYLEKFLYNIYKKFLIPFMKFF